MYRSSSSSRVSVKGVKEERKKSQRVQSSSPLWGGIGKPPVGKRASWRKMMEGMHSDAASSQNPHPVTTGEGVGVHQSGAYGGHELIVFSEQVLNLAWSMTNQWDPHHLARQFIFTGLSLIKMTGRFITPKRFNNFRMRGKFIIIRLSNSTSPTQTPTRN